MDHRLGLGTRLTISTAEADGSATTATRITVCSQHSTMSRTSVAYAANAAAGNIST